MFSIKPEDGTVEKTDRDRMSELNRALGMMKEKIEGAMNSKNEEIEKLVLNNFIVIIEKCRQILGDEEDDREWALCPSRISHEGDNQSEECMLLTVDDEVIAIRLEVDGRWRVTGMIGSSAVFMPIPEFIITIMEMLFPNPAIIINTETGERTEIQFSKDEED